MLRAQGDGDGALAAYRAALGIRETLARRDPANTEWQRDLSISHDKIGDMLTAQGDGDGALAAYRTSLGIAEILARRDPANTQWQRDLIISYMNISESEPTQARSNLSRALDIARSLKTAGRLAPADSWITEDLERRLAALPKAKRKGRRST